MRLPALVAAAALAGPALAQDPPAGEDLFPLAVGTAWTYRVSGQEERFVVRAVREEMVGEKVCVLLEATLRDRVVATEHVAFTKAGLCRFRADKDDIEPQVCVLKPGARPGTTWRPKYQLGGRAGVANFRMQGPEEVSVPAGKFKAVVVQANMGDGISWYLQTKSWYAPGVGLVKQTVEEGKRPPTTLELEKVEKPD